MFYLLNAFSPSMLGKTTAEVTFQKLSCEVARAKYQEAKSRGEIVCAIGHEGTAKLVSNLLYDEIAYNRIAISLLNGDEGLVFTLSFRVEEGKVYNYDELMELYNQNKISIYHFRVV